MTVSMDDIGLPSGCLEDVIAWAQGNGAPSELWLRRTKRKQRFVSSNVFDRPASCRAFRLQKETAPAGLGAGPSFQCAGGTAKRLHQRALQP
jgi:hypothetical protein